MGTKNLAKTKTSSLCVATRTFSSLASLAWAKVRCFRKSAHPPLMNIHPCRSFRALTQAERFVAVFVLHFTADLRDRLQAVSLMAPRGVYVCGNTTSTAGQKTKPLELEAQHPSTNRIDYHHFPILYRCERVCKGFVCLPSWSPRAFLSGLVLNSFGPSSLDRADRHRGEGCWIRGFCIRSGCPCLRGSGCMLHR